MKKLMIMAALAVASTAFAADVNIGKAVLGSGAPQYNNSIAENAQVVDNAKNENNVLHAPQYMPNYPTSATIWPRVVEVSCVKLPIGTVACDSYNWTPSMGRGEYLFVTPKFAETIKPTIVTNTVVKEVVVEVERKKKKE